MAARDMARLAIDSVEELAMVLAAAVEVLAGRKIEELAMVPAAAEVLVGRKVEEFAMVPAVAAEAAAVVVVAVAAEALVGHSVEIGP